MSLHASHLAHLEHEFQEPSEDPGMTVLPWCLHSADISNVTKEFPVCDFFSKRVYKEFFLQGEKEKELGLDVSPGRDRNTTKIPTSQMAFIKYVVAPW